MDTSGSPNNTSRFIILLPHRDAGRILDEYRNKLFCAGFFGAYSLPPAAFLAEILQPFSRRELRELAVNIRGLTQKNDGIIRTFGVTIHSFPSGIFTERSFLGLPLTPPPDEEEFRSAFPKEAGRKIIRFIFPAAVCAALENSAEIPKKIPNSEEAPSLSFRAASLANLAIRPFPSAEKGYSFEWKIGYPVWLPAHKGH